MKPIYRLHKIKEGFIITSNEIIKIQEQYLDDTNIIRRSITGEGEYWIARNGYKKLIAQEPNIIFSALKEAEQKEIGWFDVEKIALETYPIDKFEDEFDYRFRLGFKEGFQKVQELTSGRKFTDEELLYLFKKGIDWGDANCETGGKYGERWSYVNEFNNVLQFLSQPKSWEIELEMETCTAGALLDGYIPQPKITDGKVKILKLL